MDGGRLGSGGLRLWLPPAAIALAGLAAALIGFGLMRAAERDTAIERFAFRADWRAADLENKLASDVLPLAGIAAHLATLAQLDSEAFRRAVNGRYGYAPERRPRSVGFIAVVTPAERARFEAEMRRDLPDFTLEAASPDEIRYPVQFALGFDGAPASRGVDRADDSVRRRAVEDAIASGEPRSVLLGPAGRDGGGAGVAAPALAMLVPVYAGEGIPATVAERRARARGVVAGRFDVRTLLDRAIADTPAIVERLTVYAPGSAPGGSPGTGGGAARPLAAFDPEADAFVLRPAPAAAPDEIELRRALDVLGTPWQLVLTFPAAALEAQRSWAPWLWLAFGILVTALLASAAFVVQRRSGLMRLMVSRTTADLAARDRGLRQAHSQIGAIVEASPVPIVSLDAAGHVALWNPAAERITGYAAAQAVGRPPPIPLPPIPLAGDHAGTVVHARHRDGSALELLVSSAPVAGEGESAAGRIVVALDVTERSRLDRQIHQLQKMETVGQLTGGLAHDFNNLLGIIIGNLDMLVERLGDDADSRDMAQGALAAGLRGADLNRALLAFSRRQPLQPRVVDVNDLVRSMTTLLRRTLGEPIEVRLKQEPELWATLVDPAQLEAALLNLCVNARDAMPGGGSLTVETSNGHLDEAYVLANPEAAPGDYVVVSVTDTGTGMPPEVAARAFEPFFTTKDPGKGTGLGLSTVYGFIKQSGGHAKIYSEPGHGTTVRLYLPRTASSGGRVRDADGADGAAPTGRESVLVVEDNAELRAVAVRQIEALGYRVREARNGAEALALLRADPEGTDLLFSDIVMPGGVDGRVLAREATALRPGLKVLLTSGFTEASGVADGLGKGAGFLVKPYRRRDLAARIRAVLDGD